MTLRHMFKGSLVALVGLAFLTAPATLIAQVGVAGTAAATAVRSAAPTGLRAHMLSTNRSPS